MAINNQDICVNSSGEVLDEEAPDMEGSPSLSHHIGGDYSQFEVFSPVMKNGKLKRDSIENAIQAVRERLAGVFVLNAFSDEIFVVKQLPWDTGVFKPRPYNQYDVIKLAGFLERYNLDMTNARANDAIKAVAIENAIHPLKTRLERVKWDGTPRLATWIVKTFGSNQNPLYCQKIGTCWMIAAVARVFNPGCKFDHMLVLEGTQNKGKSTALRKLATFGKNYEYFCDSLSFASINDRAAIQMLQGSLIIEIAELDGMGKRDDTELKKWITMQTDRIQKKYENAITYYPRQFVLAGTTNKDSWLRDPTGNRRYWPVLVLDVNMTWLEENKEQLWAEAVHRYKEGEQYYISHDDPVYETVEGEQKARVERDPWEDAVLKIVDGRNVVRSPEVLREIVHDVAKHDSKAMSRVTDILKMNGFQRENIWNAGKPVKAWVRIKPIPEQINLDEMEDIR